MKIKEIFPCEFVFNLLKNFKNELYFTVDEKKLNIKIFKQRYLFFLFNNNCNCCGIKGTHFLLREQPIKDGNFLYHLNFASNVNNDYVNLTIDHIIPKSKGGKNCVENYQLLCERCNNVKSNSLINNNQLYSLVSFDQDTQLKMSKKEKNTYLNALRESMIFINNLVVE